MICYYCMRPVGKDEHRHVQKAMKLLLGEVCDSDIHIAIAENVFVHMTGALATQLDPEGNVVVCAFDFVREISESTVAL